jgi:hypothetical protein
MQKVRMMSKRAAERERGRRYARVSQRELGGRKDIRGNRGAKSGDRWLLRRKRWGIIVVHRMSVVVGIEMEGGRGNMETGRNVAARRFLRFALSHLHLVQVPLVNRLKLLVRYHLLLHQHLLCRLLQSLPTGMRLPVRLRLCVKKNISNVKLLHRGNPVYEVWTMRLKVEQQPVTTMKLHVRRCQEDLKIARRCGVKSMINRWFVME